jgi:hypothetical protein
MRGIVVLVPDDPDLDLDPEVPGNQERVDAAARRSLPGTTHVLAVMTGRHALTMLEGYAQALLFDGGEAPASSALRH